MNLLISFAMLKQYREMYAVLESAINAGHNLMFDSGAFSNFTSGKEIVTLEGYRDFLREHQGQYQYCINFDVVGDAEKSKRNYEYLLSCGLNPLPVLTVGSKMADLEYYKQFDYFCIGALAKESKSAKFDILGIYRAAGIDLKKAHLLGVSVPSVIYRYRPCSFDSSTFMSQSFNGQGLIYDPIRLGYEHYTDFDKENYDHYFCQYGEGERMELNAAECIRFAQHAKNFGSAMWFTVCRRKDYETLMRGRELVNSRKEMVA